MLKWHSFGVHFLSARYTKSGLLVISKLSANIFIASRIKLITEICGDLLNIQSK